MHIIPLCQKLVKYFNELHVRVIFPVYYDEHGQCSLILIKSNKKLPPQNSPQQMHNVLLF